MSATLVTRPENVRPKRACRRFDDTLTFALDFAVAHVSGLAFAQEMRRQVTAFGVLHAPGRDGRVLALVDVCRGRNIFMFTRFCALPCAPSTLRPRAVSEGKRAFPPGVGPVRSHGQTSPVNGRREARSVCQTCRFVISPSTPPSFKFNHMPIRRSNCYYAAYGRQQQQQQQQQW